MLVALATGQIAPTFELCVAVAAAPQRSNLPALVWLGEQWLPARPFWPRGMDPRAPFQLRWTNDGVVITRLQQELAPETAVTGSLTLGEAVPMVIHCASSGIEDWYVPRAIRWPSSWLQRLAELDALVLDVPRTLATAVVVAHVAGAMAPDDPLTQLLGAAGAACDETTWIAWGERETIRIRGRSEGGLLLPAALLALATRNSPEMRGYLVRAFGGRDGDRAEATRQLAHSDQPDATDTLRALLHADDRTRLVAIDTLVRREAAGELPAIVAAGTPQSPWATLAAREALERMWCLATPEIRQRTRAALAKSTSAELRGIDLERLATNAGARTPPVAVAPRPVRAMAWLGCCAIGLCIWLLRERARGRLLGC